MEERDALRLQIAAEGELFTEADDEAERAPCCDLDAVCGCEVEKLADGFELLLFRRERIGR